MKNGGYSNARVVPLYACALLCLQWGASTALMIAAQQGNCAIMELLLERGADVNAVNKVIIGSNAVTASVFELSGFIRTGRGVPTQ